MPIPWFAEAPADGRAVDVEIRRRLSLEPRSGGRRVNRGELFADGTRFALDGAVMDMYDGNRIAWFGPGLNEVPLALCSTVAAHLLAWRGMVPLHGSAVAFDDHAILIAGESGAGKSTLAHALVECGGHLVSDDLSVLLPNRDGGVPMLDSGPPRNSADRADGRRQAKAQAACPAAARRSRSASPLAMLLLLRDEPIGSDPSALTAALAGQIFRPKWMRFLPEWKLRTETVFQTAQRIAFATMPPAPQARDVSPAARAAEAIALLRRHAPG